MCKLFHSLLLLLSTTILSFSVQADPFDALIAPTVDRYAEQIYNSSQASAMVLVAIDNDQQVFRSYGEIRPGSNQRPRPDSLFRIASLTKLMTSEVMVKMNSEGSIKLSDPLSKYAPPGNRVPTYRSDQPIRLQNLATHTSGLPREQPGGVPDRAVFTWPTQYDRWRWLQNANIKVPPGVQVSYSNIAYDLLADALAKASGVPYPTLFKEKVSSQLGMKDTTYTPSSEQCYRLIVPARNASPCVSTLAAIGSGGIYSTADDMAHWMQQFLGNSSQPRSPYASQLLKMYYHRDQLSKVIGMDVPGITSSLGLGWVYMAPHDGLPGIIQKTGGGGGFITYMAIIPEKNVGVFAVVARTGNTKFRNMSDGVNKLVATLAHN